MNMSDETLSLAGLSPAQIADLRAHVAGLTVPEGVDPVPAPAHGWTCFHCCETFLTERAARLHFGPPPDGAPGCALKVEAGDIGLLGLVRDRDAEIEKLRAENESLDYRASFVGAIEAELSQRFAGAKSVHQAWLLYEAMESRALAAEAINARLWEALRSIDADAAAKLQRARIEGTLL
jgi:hypothetical protein